MNVEKTIDKFHANLKHISAKEYFVALAAVFVVLGSRDLVGEMNEHIKPIIKQPFVKKLTLFFIIFIYTKDIVVSLLVTGFVMILFPKVFFEECDEDFSNEEPTDLV